MVRLRRSRSGCREAARAFRRAAPRERLGARCMRSIKRRKRSPTSRRDRAFRRYPPIRRRPAATRSRWTSLPDLLEGNFADLHSNLDPLSRAVPRCGSDVRARADDGRRRWRWRDDDQRWHHGRHRRRRYDQRNDDRYEHDQLDHDHRQQLERPLDVDHHRRRGPDRDRGTRRDVEQSLQLDQHDGSARLTRAGRFRTNGKEPARE